MDPNETLRRARAAAGALIAALDSDDPSRVEAIDINTLAESFQALDSWLNRGGFLPTDWAASAPSQLIDADACSDCTDFAPCINHD